MKKLSLMITMIMIGSFFAMSLNAQVFDLTTGTNGSGGPGTPGTNDPIWTLQMPNGTTFDPVRISTGVLQGGTALYPNAYAQNNCGEWISPWLNAANHIISTPGTSGNYTYRMQFRVDNCMANPTAQLNLSFMAADNQLAAVRVNGVAQAIPAGITHLVTGSMSSTPAVVNGVNTIEVVVTNNGAYTALQLCGNIEVFGGLTVPQNLSCCNAQGRNLLTWDSVAGATGYYVSITYNDPECCKGSEGVADEIRYEVTENVFLFNPAACYSWKVYAFNDFCSSDWSEKQCGCYYEMQSGQTGNKTAPKSKVNNMERLYADEVITKIDPNPASNVITVSIANPTETLKTSTCELVIVNVSGVEVLRESVQLNMLKQIKVNHLRSGMYICKIVAGGRVVSTEKLVIN